MVRLSFWLPLTLITLSRCGLDARYWGGHSTRCHVLLGFKDNAFEMRIRNHVRENNRGGKHNTARESGK